MFAGIWEIVLIALIVLIVFGHKRLPAIGSAVGKSIKEFRSAAPKEPAKSEGSQAKAGDGETAKEKEDGPASDLISTGLSAIPQVRAMKGKVRAAEKIVRFFK